MDPRLLLTRGLPGAGKTSYARTLQPAVVRVNRDDLRRMLHGARLHTDHAENQVAVAQQAVVLALLAEGAAVIVDDTNLHPACVDQWHAIAAHCGAPVEIVDLTHIPLAECLHRNAGRPPADYVNPAVIQTLHERHLAA